MSPSHTRRRGRLYRCYVCLGASRRGHELYPAEQARILRLLIERIDVAPDGISVTLHAAGIHSLVAELGDHEAPALAASEAFLVHRRIQKVQFGQDLRRRLGPGEGLGSALRATWGFRPFRSETMPEELQ
jgi:hypothetical protein